MTQESRSLPEPANLSADALARRRAIVGVLGKGSVALAALTPLSGHASRTHKLFNTTSQKDCYCTVSGFQSAAISAVPSVTCGAYTPGSFFSVGTAVDFVAATNTFKNQAFQYDASTIKTTTVIGGNSSGTKGAKDTKGTWNGPADLLLWINNKLATGAVTSQQVTNFLGSSNVAILDTTKTSWVKWVSPTTLLIYTYKNFPTGIAPSGAFNTIFTNSSDSRSLLEVLNDTASGKRYFLAAYLNVANTNLAEELPVDITRAYIVAGYTDARAANATSDEYAFYKTLCWKTV